ncbi:ABC transporter permease [Rhizomonospora bruguierae]|uniref:ABC transporter permease n=1 Tax=Rhizomonospora bruguierae TaxID=1581705 RepID=UPI001BCDDD16|nr:ABC transporter permease [Micromonospora sp. NBRC 107566]
MLSLLVLAVTLGAFEIASRQRWISPLMVPAPSSVWEALTVGFERGIYWDHLLSTLSATAWGFLLATGLGIGLGGLLAALRPLERVLYPFIVAFQSTPKIALAPLVVIWLGFGVTSKILVVALVTFFPILVNTMQGLRLRDRERQELMVAVGATKWQTFRYVRLPGSVPFVFAGLHIGAIFALLGAVVAEFVGSSSGLGVLLNAERASFNVPGVFAVLLILMALGIALNAVMKALERRFTFWCREEDSPSTSI